MKRLFRKVGTFFKKHLTTLKVLFVLAVLVFVIFEVGRISDHFANRGLDCCDADADV